METNRKAAKKNLHLALGLVSKEGVSEVLAQGQMLDFKAGEFLIEQGAASKALFIILGGRFRSVVDRNNRQ